MSHEPCTLFWPRSGFTPTPSRPMLPVAMARLAIAMTVGRTLAVLGDAEPVEDRAIAAGRKKPRGGAQLAGVDAGNLAVASGELRSSAMNRAQDSKLARSQRSRTKASLTRPSVTTTWASALSTATLAPGRSGR